MRSTVLLAWLIALATATPGLAQSKAKELIDNIGQETSSPAADDSRLISPGAEEAMKRDAAKQRARNEAMVALERERAQRGWWSQLWDAIHDFEFGKILSLLLQPVPLAAIVIGGLGAWWLRRR